MIVQHPNCHYRKSLKTVNEMSDREISEDLVVRDARANDMAGIQSIYAHEVLRGSASFEEEPPSIRDLNVRRHKILRLGLPFLAAEWRGRIAG